MKKYIYMQQILYFHLNKKTHIYIYIYDYDVLRIKHKIIIISSISDILVNIM
jgi:hypothetical protein